MNEKAFVANINELIEFAKQGTVSKTIVDNDNTKIVLFAMSEGQSLSEHTASVPATIQVLDGTATVLLGGESYDASPGTLIYMPAKLPHAIDANEDLVFLLTLIRG